ncbi:MAG: hypothetical protein WCK02_05315 [Bacteroidota bacterium]
MNNTHFSKISKINANRITLVVFIALISVLTSSCFKDDFDTNRLAGGQYTPNVAVPVIHSELTLGDIIRDYDSEHMLVEDGTGFITLVYNGTVYSKLASELIIIADQNFSKTENYNLPPATPIGDSAKNNYNQVLTFATPNGGIYDSAILKTCDLKLQLSLDLNQNAKFRFSIPNATKNGIPFYKELPYTYNGSTPAMLSSDIDLSDYKIVFNNSGGNNEIDINIEAVVFNNGNPILPAYSFSFTQDFTNIKYKKLFGYLGQQTFNIAVDTVSIDIFKNNIMGAFILEDPRIKITTTNSFGMPIDVSFNAIKANSPTNAPFVVVLSGTGLPNPFSINAPTISQVGSSVRDSIYLHKNNSNFDNFINISPRTVTYSLTGLSNPQATPIKNFVLENSRFDVDLQVELPLYGRAWNFVLQDTFDFEFSKIQEIDWISFKINTTNSFPLESQIQVLFADSNYVVIDSLLNPLQSVVAAGIAGPAPAYKVTVPTNKITETTLTAAKLDKLANCKKIIVRGKLATTNNGNDIVKIYSNYKLDVKLGTRAQLKADF